MAKLKSKKRTKPARKYDNSSRALKALRTQSSILESYVELLVARSGGDVQISELAKKSGVTARTIFRFFNDKQSLQAALDEYLESYLKSAAQQMQQMDFVGFAKNAYKLFDAHEKLTKAYVLSSFGNQARANFRKKLTMAMVSRIVAERNIELNPERSKRLALVVSMVNAKIWFDISSDFNFNGDDMQEAVDWALTLLLKNI